MKKFFSLIVLLMFSVFIFIGCSSEETSSSQEAVNSPEDSYAQALTLIESKNYTEAYQLLGTEALAEYENSSELRYYCMGMTCYEEYRSFGSALKFFGWSNGILDSEEVIAEIMDYISSFNGTYYADNLEYPGMGGGHYIFVKDGKVAMEFESSYSEGPVYYIYELLEKEFPDSKELMIGSPYYSNITDSPQETDYEYTFYCADDGSVVVIGYEASDSTVFNGLYKKISNSVPDET